MTSEEERAYSILMQEFQGELPRYGRPWYKVSGSDLSMVCMNAVAGVSLYCISASEMYKRATDALRREWERPYANYYVGPMVFARVFKRAKELLNENK